MGWINIVRKVRVMPLSHCQVWDFQKCSWNSNGCFLWWKLKWGFWKGQHSENLDNGIWSHHFMANRWGNSGWLYFSGLQNHRRWWLQPWNEKTLTPWKESYDQPRQHTEKQKHYFFHKGLSSQGYGFSSGHVWMWELDCEESWVLKNWCFWTVVLENTLESHLDCKKIQPVHPKGNQS